MTLRLNRLLSMLLLAALAGCASPPPVHYWALPTTIPTNTSSTVQCTLMIRPVDVPAAYDRAAIVTSSGQQQLFWRDDERWDAPFPQVLESRLAAALRTTLSGYQVSTWSAALAGSADLELGVSVQRLNNQLGQATTLEANWLIKPTQGTSLHGQFSHSQPLADARYASLVNATAQLIDTLAATLATQIQTRHPCAKP